MQALDTYFDALRTQRWERLADCLAVDVHRTGPYGDVVEGRRAYADFLARAIGALPNYELRVHRVRPLADGAALVALSELADLGGERREFSELLLFEFDAGGAIARVDVWVKQSLPPARAR